jgi:hypothetical protein
MAAKKSSGMGMGKAYGKMEKMIEKKDKEMGMKEGSKKDLKKDMGMMPKGKGMSVMVAIGKTAPMKKGGKK